MKSTLSESIRVKQDREKVPSGRTLVSAIKRSTTDALTIISDVIKVKAIQCFPTGDFFSYFKGIIASHKESKMPMNHGLDHSVSVQF